MNLWLNQSVESVDYRVVVCQVNFHIDRLLDWLLWLHPFLRRLLNLLDRVNNIFLLFFYVFPLESERFLFFQKLSPIRIFQILVVSPRHLSQVFVLKRRNILHMLFDGKHFDGGRRFRPEHLSHQVLAHYLDILVILV